MSEDIALSSSKETTWDGRGDLTVVSGTNELAQSFSISIITSVTLNLQSLTPEAIESKREEIQRAVEGNPRSEPPVDVYGTIQTADDGSKYVEYEIFTNSTRFVIAT